MKKIVIFSILIILAASCKKGFLNKAPDEDLTIDQVFAQRRYAESWLTSTYSDVPNNIYFNDGGDPNPFVIASDELDVCWPDKFAKLMNAGSWNAVNTPIQSWDNMYQGIRKANIFLENIAKTPMVDADKQVWIGEATFLRAFYHFMNLRMYGPIPILTHSVSTGDDFSGIARQPLDSCVSFIVDECTKAEALLPITTTPDQYGRATKAAALALKEKVELYRASPLWNGNPDYANFRDNNGTAFFPASYDASRWQTAADAAKDCISQCEAAGYHLFKSVSGDPVKNYQELFLVNWNSEVLFARDCGITGWIEQCSFPCGMGGWSGWAPTQEQVDDYEMDNGTQPVSGYGINGAPIINGASGYTETGYTTTAYPGRWLSGVSNMYVHRDPRFYATVNFNGAYWISRQIQFWNTGLDGLIAGGGGHTTTGYLLKKFADSTVNIPEARWLTKTWVFFRLGEMYLDYAEALNEAQGPVTDVYKYVNAVRERVSMPDLPSGLSQDQMRTRIRHERRIELTCESDRYFDCHRWKIASTTDNSSVHGMNISAGTSLQDNSFYQRTVADPRVFVAPKHYLFPIPQTEINKDSALVQNPGW
jgi:hypothetical protein